jgi:hypothetical protein
MHADPTKIHNPQLEDVGELEPESRSEARPYISARSLLVTGRAVKSLPRRKKEDGYRLVITFAGDHEDLQRASGGRRKVMVRCHAKSDQQRTAMLLLADLRRAKTDHQYNQVIIGFFTAAREAAEKRIADSKGYMHVHRCPTQDEGGRCLCAFDWTPHEQSVSCACSPALGDMFVEDGIERRFVIHDAIETTKEQAPE